MGFELTSVGSLPGRSARRRHLRYDGGDEFLWLSRVARAARRRAQRHGTHAAAVLEVEGDTVHSTVHPIARRRYVVEARVDVAGAESSSAVEDAVCRAAEAEPGASLRAVLVGEVAPTCGYRTCWQNAARRAWPSRTGWTDPPRLRPGADRASRCAAGSSPYFWPPRIPLLRTRPSPAYTRWTVTRSWSA